MTTLASNVRSVLLSGSEGSSLQKLSPDSVLFQQNHEATGIFFIECGLVKLTRTANDGSKIILSVVGPHQLIGEECLTYGAGVHQATATCLTSVTGYHISLPVLRRLMGVPEFSMALLSYIVGRNRELASKVELLSLRDVEHRVLHGLATLAAMVKPASDSEMYPIPMTQAEIASFVGATRETTSTMLSILRSRNLLTLSRRLVTTVHPDILISAANDRLSRSKTTH